MQENQKLVFKHLQLIKACASRLENIKKNKTRERNFFQFMASAIAKRR